MRKLIAVVGVAAFLSFSARSVNAQLYWDGTDLTADADGGDGTWDVNRTANWNDTATGGNAVTWPFTGADMVLGGTGGTLTISDNAIGTGTATIVNNLTIEPGVGRYKFLSADDGGGPVLGGSATWNINDNRLDLVNLNDTNDTALYMPAGGTLTVTGTGTFDTGEKPGAATATWNVPGAILDFQAGTLRGNPASIGQFTTVKMADGSTFVHERNANQSYANNWELNGDVTFSNRWFRSVTVSGEISGSGRLVVADMGNATQSSFVRLTNPDNSFNGGVTIDSTVTASELQITPGGGDGAFGALPATFDPDNILLIGDGADKRGELKMQGVTIHSNRGITLQDGGTIINTGAPNTYGGTITGTGGLQIGRDQGADGNRLILTSDTHDYTGGTRIFKGALELGIDNAIPKDILTIGGTQGTGSVAQLYTQGFDLEVTGIRTLGNQTRTIINESANDSTIIFDVADGESYTYSSNFNDKVNDTANGTADDGTIHIVKNGEGVQVFNRTSTNTSWYGNATVNGGRLRIQSPKFFDNNNDGTLNIVGNNGTRITVNNGGTLVLNAGNVVTNNEWAEADLDEVLNNANFATGSRLGINTDSGDFTYSANIRGVQGIEKVGGNTLTLTGTNTYSGPTVVDENNNHGILLINGDNSAATGDVLVQNGTLGGTGTLGGDTTVSAGAAIAPGVTTGTLNFGGNALMMATNVVQPGDPDPVTLVSELNFDLEGSNMTIGSGINDLLEGVGALTLDGAINVTELTTGGFLSATMGDMWRLINYSGSFVNNTLELGDVPDLSAGLEFRIDTATLGQVNLLVASATAGLACDLNGVDGCDLTDLDLLYNTGPTTEDIATWLSQASDPANPYKTSYPGGSTTDVYRTGDVNLDGDVNSSDLGALLNNFGSTAGVTWSGGDLNADSNVNSSDLGALLNNFGSSSAAASVVPEPRGICLMLPLLIAGLAARRRRD